MLKLFRSGPDGRPGPAVKIVAVLIAVGLLATLAPFVSEIAAWFDGS